MTTKAKGFAIRSIGEYIQTLDPALRQRIEAGMTSEQLKVLYEGVGDEMYPYEFYGATYRAIANAFDNPEEGRRAVETAGGYAAEAMTNSFMRNLIRMMTPALFAQKCAQFMGRDFEGFEGGGPDISYDLSREKEGEIVMELRNAGKHPYLGASAVGFIKFVFEGMGKEGVKVEERDCEVTSYSAPFARWYISWKP